VQYDCWGKKIERVIHEITEEPVSRKEYLLWKIVRGDASDNIKNVFPKYGDKKSWELIHDMNRLSKMLFEDNGAAERFKLNSTLIDFRHIPKDCIERIEKAVDEKLSESVTNGGFDLEGCMVL
jgi:5'-3' exonuclease